MNYEKVKLVLILFVLPIMVIGQNLDSLETERKNHIREGWSTLGISLFGYGLSSTNLMFGSTNGDVYTANINNPNSYVAMIPTVTIGLTFNTLAITHFIKARKIKKQINLCTEF